MKKTMFLCFLVILIITSVTASSKKTFVVGERGPAGGWVFYDKGSYSDGWRYLECAPAQHEFEADWGADGKDIRGTTEFVGDGMKNTKLIADFLKNINETDCAAQKCLALKINGYSDWFLPTKNELDLMYTKLAQVGNGEFSKVWYWSSSQFHSDDAWVQYFGIGSQDYYSKDDDILDLEVRVRACRAF